VGDENKAARLPAELAELKRNPLVKGLF